MDPEARPPAPRWRRRPEARPDQVLDAALDQFIARGFAATRMEDVAAAAGLSKAALYLYFDGKDALFRALVERRMAPTRELLAAMAAAGAHDPVAGLRAFVAHWTQMTGDERTAAIPRIVLAEAARFPEMARFYHAEVVTPVSAAVAAIIQRGIHQGVFRAMDAGAAARMLMAPLLVEVWRARAFAGLEPARTAADVARETLDMFLNGALPAHRGAQ